MDLNQIFIKNLKSIRLEKGWSQEELAEECGLHRTYISMIERNKRNITIVTLDKISKALDISPCDLLKRTGVR